MISDTLSDAAHEIRKYLCENSDTYADMLGDILALLAEMDRVRIKLDTPPGGAPSPGQGAQNPPRPHSNR